MPKPKSKGGKDSEDSAKKGKNKKNVSEDFEANEPKEEFAASVPPNDANRNSVSEIQKTEQVEQQQQQILLENIVDFKYEEPVLTLTIIERYFLNIWYWLRF